MPVLVQRDGVSPPRTWVPSGAVRVTAVRLPPVTLTTTGLSSAHAVAPAAGLVICGAGVVTVAARDGAARGLRGTGSEARPAEGQQQHRRDQERQGAAS